MKTISAVLKNLLQSEDESYKITHHYFPKFLDLASSILLWNHSDENQIKSELIE